MPELLPFDYAVVRVVPRVERGEFVNAGVILFCSRGAFLDCRIELDRERLCALAPTVDCDEIEANLAVIPRVCTGGPEAGRIGALSQRERFHWLVAPRSTVIQTSPVHSGVHTDMNVALDALFKKLVKA